jgi:nitroreductase
MTGEAVPPAGDPPGPSRQLIDELLRAAVAAPSLHNAQPWRFRIWPSSGVIEAGR